MQDPILLEVLEVSRTYKYGNFKVVIEKTSTTQTFLFYRDGDTKIIASDSLTSDELLVLSKLFEIAHIEANKIKL